jgi:hypothetical protein
MVYSIWEVVNKLDANTVAFYTGELSNSGFGTIGVLE